MIETYTQYAQVPIGTGKRHVQYYVKAECYVDPHFRPDPPFVVRDKYFETEKEAKEFMQQMKKVYTMHELWICKKVTDLGE